MKKLFIVVMFMVASTTYAETNSADTIRVNNALIENVIEHKTTNTKGNPVIKYFIIYQGELVATSKTVVEKITLAKKYKVKCPLALVNKNGNKRIILK